jgi:hypothetical protein
MRAGRSAHLPTSADRERIAQALRSRIEGGGFSDVPSAIASPRGFLWLIPTAVAVGLVAGGFLIAGAGRSDGTKMPPPRATASVPAPPAIFPPPVRVHPVAPSAALSGEEQRPSAREQAPGRTRKPASDQLAEEVEILSRAQTELRAGRLPGALRVLEGHARKFPRGALAQERIAARIQALCGLGRLSEANAELARLSPGSLHERRAREACGTARTPAAD